MIRKYLTWLLPAFVLASSFALAAPSAPEALVTNVTDEVLTTLRQDKGIQSGNRQRVAALIETKVAPHFDFARMTSLAVGRPWREANAEQRSALVGEFRTLLVRTYANALTAYHDQTVSLKPSTNQENGNEVTVHCQINKPGAEAIAIDYSLANSQGDWKVFDVAIAGISLVTNYRNTFASEVAKGGLDGLIKALQEKNRRT